ncbi:LysM domain-containing protein [Neobacillus sp. MM2021_6]|uniref:DUF6448 family protein n=1 Tax=Bacillaceae TaxID=186817 RepID=UPI0014083CB3|nr:MULTISPECIES: DUF6448 family protein [Bacillaceae]MBO0959702.1 LysM domain-containing protein [Neobacillus sp. MM2021_6]NHC20458.1 LysM domain-containing protein [Bacillus sp. MM2020_4]
MKRVKRSKFIGALLMALVILAIVPTMASAHCDTMDGPVVGDAHKALESNNPSYILKWVQPEDEKEMSQIFALTMKVRNASPEAQEVADQYLFENLIRIHRAGEGAAYTGVKPHGTPIDEKVAAADKSIEVGNLSPLEKLVPQDQLPELQERLDKVLSLKDYDVNNVSAGREYIESYVSFFHFAEGEEEGHETGHTEQSKEDAHAGDQHASADVSKQIHEEDSQKGAGTLPLIPWSVAAILFVTTLIFAIAYHREHSK